MRFREIISEMTKSHDDIQYHIDNTFESEHDAVSNLCYEYKCQSRVPSPLHTNRESRIQALRFYRFLFQDKPGQSNTYVNDSVDTGYLYTYSIPDTFRTLAEAVTRLCAIDSGGRLRSLAIDYAHFEARKEELNKLDTISDPAEKNALAWCSTLTICDSLET